MGFQMNKEQLGKELEECKFRLKEFQKKGVDLFLESPHKEILKKWIDEKLREDIKYFEDRLKGCFL
jgi:uncharacterized protein (DUF302 family)